MDDSGINNKNQPTKSGPIFDAATPRDTPQPIMIEEVSPAVESPEEIRGSTPPNIPPDIPVYHDSPNKFGFIIGVIIFFLIIFGLVYWFFLKDKFQGGAVVKQELVTLTYWGLWDEPSVYDSLIEEYHKKNKNITIKYEKMSPQQYRERLVARSKTGNGPDIFRFHNTWVPELKDVLTPLPSTLMTNKVFEDTFYPIHQRDLKVGTEYYGMPLSIDALVLIYNDKLLRQAGVSGPPVVWVGDQNDMINTVSKITVRDSAGLIVTSGVSLGTAANVDHFSDIYGMLLLLNGGDLKKLDTTQASEALELYRSFAEENYWNDAMPNSISAFTSGKTAMIFGPTWHVINIKSQNPDITVKIAQVPKGLDNKQITIANYWVEGVNKFSKSQLEAWKFLVYLSEKESLTKIYENQTKTRLFGTAYSRRDMGDLLKDNEYLGPIISMAKSDAIKSLPLVDRTYDAGLNDEVIQYLENAINQTINGVDYESALKTAQTGVLSVFERFGIK